MCIDRNIILLFKKSKGDPSFHIDGFRRFEIILLQYKTNININSCFKYFITIKFILKTQVKKEFW